MDKKEEQEQEQEEEEEEEEGLGCPPTLFVCLRLQKSHIVCIPQTPPSSSFIMSIGLGLMIHNLQFNQWYEEGSRSTLVCKQT